MFSLDSISLDSNEHTQYTIFNKKKKKDERKKHPKIILNLQLWDSSNKLNKFEIAVVKEPSVFKPLKSTVGI